MPVGPKRDTYDRCGIQCRIGKFRQRCMRKSNSALAASTSRAEESLRRISLVKAHGYEATELRRYRAALADKVAVDKCNVAGSAVRCFTSLLENELITSETRAPMQTMYRDALSAQQAQRYMLTVAATLQIYTQVATLTWHTGMVAGLALGVVYAVAGMNTAAELTAFVLYAERVANAGQAVFENYATLLERLGSIDKVLRCVRKLEKLSCTV